MQGTHHSCWWLVGILFTHFPADVKTALNCLTRTCESTIHGTHHNCWRLVRILFTHITSVKTTLRLLDTLSVNQLYTELIIIVDAWSVYILHQVLLNVKIWFNLGKCYSLLFYFTTYREAPVRIFNVCERFDRRKQQEQQKCIVLICMLLFLNGVCYDWHFKCIVLIVCCYF